MIDPYGVIFLIVSLFAFPNWGRWHGVSRDG